MELFINMVLLTLLAAITIGIIRVRNLFSVVVLAGAYSFLMASVMIVLDAVDVAMTEAAVGAGVSTVLALGRERRRSRYVSRRNLHRVRLAAPYRCRSQPALAIELSHAGEWRRDIAPGMLPRDRTGH